MKKVNVKSEILMIIMIVIAIFAISSQVFATSNSPVQIPVINTGTNDTNTTTANETVTITPNPVTPTTNTIANTTVSTYENTTLPQTGDASDYAIFMLIVVAIIVAVYAYIKVGQYNIK